VEGDASPPAPSPKSDRAKITAALLLGLLDKINHNNPTVKTP
jgi:hypothetical protein